MSKTTQEWQNTLDKTPPYAAKESVAGSIGCLAQRLIRERKEALEEVVRLRKALDKLAHEAYVMANHYYYMGGKRYDDLGSTEQSYYEALTRILEGDSDE